MQPHTTSRHWLDRLADLLRQREETSLRRELRPLHRCRRPDRSVAASDAHIDLSDNDYLRLRRHPHLIEAAQRAAAREGVGSGSSRLVSGTTPAHAALEARFARFKGTESALLFPTGYMANVAVLSALAQPGDLVVLDKFCHASLIDGARLAAAQGAAMRTFPHGALPRLADLLRAHHRESPRSARFIVTDSVFSMDGDVADLSRLAELRDAFDAALIVDEAHATGVLGPTGAGADANHLADITISTASKALGALGGLVTGPRLVIDWLVNAARPFIFTTAAPPPQIAAIDAALDLVEREPQRRRRLSDLVRNVRAGLRAAGVEVRSDPTPIIPIVVGVAERAVALADFLRARGIEAPAIRPPTVAPSTARVRLSLHCELSDEDVQRLCRAVRDFLAAGTA